MGVPNAATKLAKWDSHKVMIGVSAASQTYARSQGVKEVFPERNRERKRLASGTVLAGTMQLRTHN
jgi:hypothetical protein